MFRKIAKSVLNSVGITLRREGKGWWIGGGSAVDSDPETLFTRKFGTDAVQHAVDEARRRWPDRQVVVLSDARRPRTMEGGSWILCGEEPVEQVDACSATKSVFVYACDSDACGLPYVRRVVELRGIFCPVQVYTPSRYSNINDSARRAIEREHSRQSAEGFLKFDYGPGDSLNLAQAIALTAHLDGCYVEIGCFNGSSSCIALSFMRESSIRRDCYFLDVFEGFTYEAARQSADSMWSGTHASEGIDTVRARIMSSADDSKGIHAQVLKSNIVEAELPPEIGSIAVANIDVDLYEAVLAALQKLSPRMCRGAIIVVEDPGHTPALIGSRLALEEFLASPSAAGFLPIYLESGQTYLLNVGIGTRSHP